MPRFGFAIDNRACIGCHACTVACKAEHEVPIGVNRTWVKYIEKGDFPNTRRHFSVQRCNHCADAPCVEICPVTSLFTRPDGIVDFDSDRCIGCKSCMQACPYDALYLDPATNTAAKCNYCTHRVDNGYEPACVVVCPVEAIVSGDLDDAESRISQLDRLQKVQYPKIEKGTQPKLFYVGGESAAIDPAAAPPVENYIWSGNDGRVSRVSLTIAGEEAEQAARARRVYDPASKPAPWGWMVSAYITTKALATGLPLISFIMYLVGIAPSPISTPAFFVSLSFLAATGVLLVGDLKQPRRFLYVMLRPQWKSWLVRGAYLIAAYSVALPLLWIMALVGGQREIRIADAGDLLRYAVPVGGSSGGVGLLVVGYVVAALAVCVAGYTALLLAQARGRDYWQNPLLVWSMIVDALVAGTSAAVLLGLMNWSRGSVSVLGDSELGARTGTIPNPAQFWLAVCVLLLLVTTIAEYLPRHQTQNAERTAKLIVRGAFAGWFWVGVIVIGMVVPGMVLMASGPTWAAAIALLLGIIAKNHVLVQAPQRVPLS